MNYINSLVSVHKHKIDGDDHISSGLALPSELGRNVGFEEVRITHPYTNSPILGGIPNAFNLNGSMFEADYYPRSIIDKAHSYNFEFNVPDNANQWSWGNAYFAAFNYLNGGAVPTQNSGYWPTVALNANGGTVSTD